MKTAGAVVGSAGRMSVTGTMGTAGMGAAATGVGLGDERESEDNGCRHHCCESCQVFHMPVVLI